MQKGFSGGVSRLAVAAFIDWCTERDTPPLRRGACTSMAINLTSMFDVQIVKTYDVIRFYYLYVNDPRAT